MSGKTNLRELLENMNPKFNNGEYIFCTLPPGSEKRSIQPIMQFREKEGVTLILEKKEADKAGIKYKAVFSWITLTVHSSLEAHGFTAAISGALTEKQIPCNVVAGYYHDHLFVPKEDAERAMTVLNGYRTE